MVESVIRCLRKYSSRDKDVGSQYNLPERLVTRSASRSSLLRSLLIVSEPDSHVGRLSYYVPVWRTVRLNKIFVRLLVNAAVGQPSSLTCPKSRYHQVSNGGGIANHDCL
jgi:hypothetical protein